MRLFATTTAAALVLLSVPAMASAHPVALIGLPDPVADLQTSDNVHHVLHFPEHRATSGGRLFDGRFYITDATGVHVYDVADPLNPVKLGSLLVPQIGQGLALGQEDPDTNGRILLLDAMQTDSPSAGRLQIVDVSDPANMSVLAEVNQTAHTWTCIADCTYAYGRDGEIIDLNDPSNPVLLPNTWREGIGLPATGNGGANYVHDITEVGPGRAVTAGQTSTYVDTTDPANPVALATNPTSFYTLGYHGIEWANGGQDDIVVFGTEIAPDNGTPENATGDDCQDEVSVLATFATSDLLAGESAVESGGKFGTREFIPLDTWKVEGRGAYVDGQAPGHVLYCAHWFNLHPEWNNGGLLAAGYYEWGTRIVQVASDGSMSEYGWFLPSDGYTSAAYWITRDVVYVADYVRGLDVIHVDVEAAADPSPEGQVASGEIEFEDLPEPVAVPAAEEGPTTPVTGAGMVGLAMGTLGAGWGLRLRRRR